MLTSNVGQIALGAAAASAIVIVAVMIAPPNRWGDPETVTPAPVVEVQPADPGSNEVEPVIDLPDLIVPVADTLRVDADGEMLIAGRAAASVALAIMLDRAELTRVMTDTSGGFVAFASLPPSEDTRVVVLLADPDGVATQSDQSYYIAPIAAPMLAEVAEPIVEDDAAVAAVVDPSDPVEPEVASEGIASTEPDGATATGTAVVELAEPTTPQPDVVSEQPDAEPVPAAPPAIIVADADGVKLLQTSGSAPDVLDNVALDSITYDPTGEVLIAGRAAGDGFVNVYLDNKPITSSRISQSGDWRTDLPDIDTGVYTLRVDEVDQAGVVVSRIETPFKREEAEVVATVLAEETADPNFQVAVTTVQPGTTLWAIALEKFGSGIRYVEVFEANRDLIKNPDLIYPGQVFRLPEGDGQ